MASFAKGKNTESWVSVFGEETAVQNVMSERRTKSQPKFFRHIWGLLNEGQELITAIWSANDGVCGGICQSAIDLAREPSSYSGFKFPIEKRKQAA